VIEYIVYS